MTATETTVATDNYGPHPDTPHIELRRFFSRKRRALMSLRSDGAIYSKSLTHGWKCVSQMPEAMTIKDRLTWFENWQLSGKPWQSMVRDIPTLDDLERQLYADSTCETPDGEYVEPDGESHAGVPSWLRIFGLI